MLFFWLTGKQGTGKDLGTWKVQINREKKVSLVLEEEKGGLAELLPLRHERMSASPFSFFRGADVIMASYLAEAVTAGIRVQACGDANIASFDIFVSPERRLVFDICDFDETLPAPWDYDVRRLMAGIEICSRDRGFSRGERIRILNHAAASTADQLLESTAEQNEYVQIQNGKFCAQAWNAIQQYVYTALHGGALQPGKSRDERVMIASCTDGGFPYGTTWEEMGIDTDLSL